jgi:transcriptional regulator with XRE-family HTH domain
VQKYENGKNRIGASRLQHISHILQIPVPFFFDGAPHLPGQPEGIVEAPWPAYVSDFLATADGLALTKAFMRVKNASCGDVSSSLSRRSQATMMNQVEFEAKLASQSLYRWASSGECRLSP